MSDEFGGGHLIEGNLFFNAVRETGDHGPFNSYSRLAQLTISRDTAGIIASYMPVRASTFINTAFNLEQLSQRENLLLSLGGGEHHAKYDFSNYHSAWPLDHDDGR